LNHLRGYLRSAFEAARRAGKYGGTNPAAEVRKRRVPRRVPDYLKANEVPSVMEALDAAWRPLFATAIYTGMRKGELLELRKTDVHFDAGLITVARSYDSDTTKRRHDDYTGNAAVARALAVPVQIGENFNGPEAMADALAAEACDLVMPDVARIGGVTGWMHAAGVAAAHGMEMSSHLHPEISVHLLAATPTCHLLEYVDWASAILEEPLQIRDGAAHVPDRPGLGLAWREEAVKALALDR
jgi:hypothetical protein